jgi:hypothetical protein
MSHRDRRTATCSGFGAGENSTSTRSCLPEHGLKRS